MEKWKWYIYIIECKDGTFYTGMTYNVSKRWEQHEAGVGSVYTSNHKPEKIVYIEEFEDLETARKREIQIKDWSQEKKKKLISGEWSKEW